MQLRIFSLVTCFFWGWYCPVMTEITVSPEDPDASLILFIDEQEHNFNHYNDSKGTGNSVFPLPFAH